MIGSITIDTEQLKIEEKKMTTQTLSSGRLEIVLSRIRGVCAGKPDVGLLSIKILITDW